MGQVNADGEQGEAAFDLRPPVYPRSSLYSRVARLDNPMWRRRIRVENMKTKLLKSAVRVLGTVAVVVFMAWILSPNRPAAIITPRGKGLIRQSCRSMSRHCRNVSPLATGSIGKILTDVPTILPSISGRQEPPLNSRHFMWVKDNPMSILRQDCSELI